LIEGLLRQLRAARDFRPQGFLRFEVGADALGWIRRDLAVHLRAWPSVFEQSQSSVRMQPAGEAALSATLAGVAQGLKHDGVIRGWRDETYEIRTQDRKNVAFHIERAARRFFGLTSSSAHLNGYWGTGANLQVAIARRAATKSIDPGMLDNLVAGGVRSGQDPWQTLLRESGEEAGIPEALAAKARSAGVLRICREVPEGLDSEDLFVYDLELPANYAPRNTDGEVSEFMTLAPAALLERIARGELTVDAGLVAADFMLRHGAISDETGAIRTAIST
jgi:8-oxo-dGTP pyrophosphatase MutT (NUDIX family)